MASQLFVLFIKHMLDIEEHQIGNGHQLFDFFGMVRIEQDAAGIQRRVDPVLLGFGKKLGEKINLEHRFAAGGGDAAGGIKLPGMRSSPAPSTKECDYHVGTDWTHPFP